MFVPLFGVLIYFLFFLNKEPSPEIIIHRTLPSHFIAGQPIPVFISISNAHKDPLSFIIRENLPPGTHYLSSYPETAIKPKNNGSIQWLGTVADNHLFTYTITTEQTFTGSLVFEGSLKLSSEKSLELKVEGDQTTSADLYHWADSDRDNRISDEEILSIYDLTNAKHHGSIDMDLLEEIWLGEGYTWQPESQKFSIHE